MTETWLPVVGYEGLYEVSDIGRVRSSRHVPPMLLSSWADGDGYLRIGLWDGDVQRKFALHRLVALAFHGGKQNALHNEVAHLDGDRANPRADNLKWVSKVENQSHKRRHGTHQAGEGHPSAKLTTAAVHEIRLRRGTAKELAVRYRVSRHTIYDIWQGVRWKSLSSG